MIIIFNFAVSFILISILFDRLRAWTQIPAESYSPPFWIAVGVLFAIFYLAIKLWLRRLAKRQED